MRHSLRIVGALAGVTLASPTAAQVPLATGTAARMMVMPPNRPPRPPAQNPARCPRVKPAFGANCAPALRDLACSYQLAATRVSYVCRSSRPNAAPHWSVGSSRAPDENYAPMVGPLAPPELPA